MIASNTDKKLPEIKRQLHLRFREITYALYENTDALRKITGAINRLADRSGDTNTYNINIEDCPLPTQEALACIQQVSFIEDLICEKSFNLQKTIARLEDCRNKLEPHLALLARDSELQRDYKNAFNPSGWSDRFEVRAKHFLELQLLRVRIVQYFASTGETGETSTQES